MNMYVNCKLMSDELYQFDVTLRWFVKLSIITIFYC
jgi:hypothetical protein